MSVKIGVLSLIGSFIEHEVSLKNAFNAGKNEDKWPGIKDMLVTRVISKDQVNEDLDGLIIPGGESTVISKFLSENDFYNVLKAWTDEQNKFTWGTCAGLILLSDKVVNGDKIANIGGIGITCTRNAYGRQIQSSDREFEIVDDELKNALKSSQNSSIFSSTLIRAPAIVTVDNAEVKVLSQSTEDMYMNLHRANAVVHGNKMASSFHPELTNELRWHAYFISQVFKRKFTYR